MLDTSSAPSLRRPISDASAAQVLVGADVAVWALTAPVFAPAASVPAARSRPRRFTSMGCFVFICLSSAGGMVSLAVGRLQCPAGVMPDSGVKPGNRADAKKEPGGILLKIPELHRRDQKKPRSDVEFAGTEDTANCNCSNQNPEKNGGAEAALAGAGDAGHNVHDDRPMQAEMERSNDQGPVGRED